MPFTPQTSKIILFCALLFSTFTIFSQQIGVIGNSIYISDNDSTPSTTDFTAFGTETSRTFYVGNIQGTGNTTLTITSITLSNTTDFTISSNLGDYTLGKSQISPFTISLNGTSCGTATSTVTIVSSNASNDGADNSWVFTISSTRNPEINVLGNAVSIVDGDPTPSTVDNTDFGSTDTGVPIIKTYTVQNTGNCALTIGSFSFTGTNASEFTLETAPAATVNAGNSTTFQVKFLPTAGGTRTATLSFVNNDSNENPYNFNIQGTSIAPLTEGPGGVVASLQLWLKSTDGLGYSNGTGVSLWQTQARGSNATVNTVGQEPTFYDNSTNNVNFNPVISFNNDRTNAPEEYNYAYTPQEYLEGTSGFYSQEIFIVAIPDDVINNTYASMDLFCGDSPLVVSSEDDGTGIGYGSYTQRFDTESITYAIGTTSGTSTPANDRGYGIADTNASSSYSGIAILNVRDNTSAPIDGSELYYNGKNIESEEVGLPQFINIEDTRFWIGRSQGYRASFEGRVTEVITYSTRKNDTSERNRIESYLAIKYGITLADAGAGTTKDYVDSDGTVIWNHITNAGFNYDIAGIGYDEASELNQKQSKTVNTADDITIGLNEITATNNLNTNTFTTNKTFLVWGNNNDVLTGQPAVIVDMSLGIAPAITPDGTKVEFTPMGRKWKVASKGTNFSAKVSIPQTLLIPLGPPPGDYLMFISDSPIFNPDAEYRIMSSDGLGNFQTNYTFSGTKYITFGFAPEKTFVRSIQFDGVQDYLDAGDVLDLNALEFTISAWIKRDPTSVNASILSKRDGGFNEGYGFELNPLGKLKMSWINGTPQTITSNTIIPGNVWHHVAVIYSGGTASLYIDGVLDNTVSLSAPVATTQSFYIAAAGKLTRQSFFKGNIDEVRIWDVALTEDQLRFVMNQEIENNTNVDGSYFTSLGFTPTKNDINSVPWANLMGYYPMSTYTFTNCKDASGNGNTAALKNLTTVDLQTAPLPYVSAAGVSTDWDTSTSWTNGDMQTIPGAKSIIAPTIDRDGDLDVDEDDRYTIDWNIVQISSDVTMNNNILSGANNGNRNVLGLIVNNTFKLTIDGDNTTSAGNGLIVTHYLKLDGVLDLDGESQLIQTIDSDFDATSTGYLERDQQGIENSFRYNYWSSPVNSTGTKYTVGGVLRDGTDPNNIKTIDFGTSYAYADVGITSPIKLSSYWMYVLKNSGLGYSAWSRISDTGELLLGEGYTMKGSNTNLAEQNYTFVGKPNNGTINLPVSANNEYLIGNPYASAIDAYQFIDDNGPSGTSSIGNGGRLIFWEHYGGDTHNLKDYQGGYAILTKASGVPASSNVPAGVSSLGLSVKGAPGRYIPVGQAFFVDGSITGGNIQFNNGQRVFVKETSGVSVFMKSSSSKSKIVTANKTDLRSKFRIGFDTPKISHRQLLLTLDENTSDEVDWGYDAEIYNIVNDDMYWMIDAKKYVIQATNALTSDKEIPLGIETKEGGVIRIMIDALENVDENTKIYIKDNLTGETYDITNQAFEINLEAGEYQERFVLTFQPRIKTLEEVTLIEGVHIFMNNSISELQLNRIVDTEIKSVTLFNYLGQQVKAWNINTDERFISLPLQIATGVYIAQVHTTDGIITKKIIIE